LSSTNPLLMRYIWGDDPNQLFARVDSSGNVGWFLTDHLGSVRDIANASGQVIDHVNYDAFGNTLSETNPSAGGRIKFQGGEYDPETGLYRFGARYLNTTTGQWLTEDPLGFGGGDTNLKRFVGNGPTNGTDPSGLEIISNFEIDSYLDEVMVTKYMKEKKNDGYHYTSDGVQWKNRDYPSEIVAKMIISKRQFTLNNLLGTKDGAIAALKRQVVARIDKIGAALKKKYEFGAGKKERFNPDIWELKDGQWKPKPGVRQADADKDILEHGEKYAIACALATEICIRAGGESTRDPNTIVSPDT